MSQLHVRTETRQKSHIICVLSQAYIIISFAGKTMLEESYYLGKVSKYMSSSSLDTGLKNSGYLHFLVAGISSVIIISLAEFWTKRRVTSPRTCTHGYVTISSVGSIQGGEKSHISQMLYQAICHSVTGGENTGRRDTLPR